MNAKISRARITWTDRSLDLEPHFADFEETEVKSRYAERILVVKDFGGMTPWDFSRRIFEIIDSLKIESEKIFLSLSHEVISG